MTSTRDVEQTLQHLADLIAGERDPYKQALMVGSFRHESRRLGQSLLGSVGYRMKQEGFSAVVIAEAMRAARRTVSSAILDHCVTKGLKPPRGFRHFTVDPNKVVTLPPREG